MDGLDGRHHPDRRSRHGREVGDLAGHVHAHLEHGRLVSGAETHEREWQPDLVVLVALGLECPQGTAEHGRDGFLRGRLGDAAGDPDDQWIEPLPPAGRDGPERSQTVSHADDRHVAECRRLFDAAGDEQGRGPTANGFVEVQVTVRPFARERYEQLPGDHEPGVDGRACHAAIRAGEEAAAGQAGEIIGGECGRGVGLRRHRRVDAHGGQCRIDPTHRSVTGTGSATTRSSSRSGVRMASVATRRKSSKDMTGISNRPT